MTNKKNKKKKKIFKTLIFFIFLLFIFLRSDFSTFLLPNRNDRGLRKFVYLRYNKGLKNKKISVKNIKIKIYRTLIDYNNNTGLVDLRLTMCSDNDCFNKEDIRRYEKWIFKDNRWHFLNSDVSCFRLEPYSNNPAELMRAYDLAYEKINIFIHKGFDFDTPDIRNCIYFEYSDLGDAEALFRGDLSNQDKFVIQVDHKYKNYDDLFRAFIITHEYIHASYYLFKNVWNYYHQPPTCLEEEAEAFFYQIVFLSSLNNQEQSSLTSRFPRYFYQIQNLQGPYGILWDLIFGVFRKSKQICGYPISPYAPTEEQRKCLHRKLKELIINKLQSDEYYKNQCNSTN